MPQRSSLTIFQEPTSLRRSPRLLELKNSPKPPNPTSKTTLTTPISTSTSKDSTNPKNKSRNCTNYSICLKQNRIGSGDCSESATGSARKSNLGKDIGGIRRTSRLSNKVLSEIDANLSVNCTRSRRGLKKLDLVGIGELAVQDLVVSPVTPIRVEEKKFGDVLSDSGGLTLENFEKRITRSVSRKLRENVEAKKIENKRLKGNDLFGSQICGSKMKKVVRPVCAVKGKSNVLGKENCNDSCKVVVCGLMAVECDSRLRCATPGGGRGRRCLKDRSKMDGEGGDSGEQMDGNFEKRITRSASKLMARKNDLSRQGTSIAAKSGLEIVECKTTMQENQKRRDTIKSCKTGLRKRVQKNAITSFSARLEEEVTAGSDISSKKKKSHDCVEQGKDMARNVRSDDVKSNLQNATQGAQLIGVKRKRKQAVSQGTDQGWAKDQEAILQKAYFTAKPSPRFWKKVAKLVPGKSAQECFDKVHSFNLTPISTRQTSMVKKLDSPSEISLVGNGLFKSIETKRKKTCSTKRKSHVARKNVRHLLNKYCEGNEPDLFSILEPAVNPAVEALKLNAVQLTPKQPSGNPGSAAKCRSMSSSGHKKPLSRLSGLRSPLTSPLVLKKVKNMALHEKYIDQLHIREGKRKVVSARNFKSVQSQNGGVKKPAQMKDVVRAAKDALVSDARAAIEKFRHTQTNIMEAYSDSDDVFINDEGNEDDMSV